MSLEDFFNKKSRKKTKKTINAQELFEQITDGPQRQKSDVEINPDDTAALKSDDVGEWEPIVNDDIELDFSNIRIGDLATAKTEEEHATTSNTSLTNKLEDPPVVWGGRIKKEEDSVEACAKSTKPRSYIPLHLRDGGLNTQALPNLESTEEFPTLDVAAQEKPKKSYIPENVDNSWTEVSKNNAPRRKDEFSFPESSITSNSYQYGPYNKYPSSTFRDNCPPRLSHSTAAGTLQSSRPGAWLRGEVLKSETANSETSTLSKMSSWAPRSGPSSGTPKSYVIPQQKSILSFTQENRFAQLDNS